MVQAVQKTLPELGRSEQSPVQGKKELSGREYSDLKKATASEASTFQKVVDVFKGVLNFLTQKRVVLALAGVGAGCAATIYGPDVVAKATPYLGQAKESMTAAGSSVAGVVTGTASRLAGLVLLPFQAIRNYFSSKPAPMYDRPIGPGLPNVPMYDRPIGPITKEEAAIISMSSKGDVLERLLALPTDVLLSVGALLATGLITSANVLRNVRP